MSVRQSLLAILAQGPLLRLPAPTRVRSPHRLDLAAERRTDLQQPSSAWNATAGLAWRCRRPTVMVFWQITDAGHTDVETGSPPPSCAPRAPSDELAIKLAVARRPSPGVDAAATIDAQRSASMRQLEALQHERQARGDGDDPEGLAWSLVADSMSLRRGGRSPLARSRGAAPQRASPPCAVARAHRRTPQAREAGEWPEPRSPRPCPPCDRRRRRLPHAATGVRSPFAPSGCSATTGPGETRIGSWLDLGQTQTRTGRTRRTGRRSGSPCRTASPGQRRRADPHDLGRALLRRSGTRRVAHR